MLERHVKAQEQRLKYVFVFSVRVAEVLGLYQLNKAKKKELCGLLFHSI